MKHVGRNGSVCRHMSAYKYVRCLKNKSVAVNFVVFRYLQEENAISCEHADCGKDT